MKKAGLLLSCLAGLLILSGCLPQKKVQGPTPVGGELPSKEVGPTPISSQEVALEGRPYVTLTPRSDGKEITLSLSGIVGAKSLEYELVYFAGEPRNQLQRGVVGAVDLQGKTDYTKSLLLGTCSRNVCKYDENVTEGTLSLTFRKESGETQKYQSIFHLQRGKEGKEGLTSGDGNFQFVSQSLPSSGFYLTCSTVGLFQMPAGKVVGGPYGIFTAGSSKVTGQVTLKLQNPSKNAKIMLWDGKKWNELETTVSSDGLSVSATTGQLGTFVVIEE